MPTKDSKKPNSAIKSPFTTDWPVKLMTIVTESSISAKYSGGPKARAYSANRGAKKVSPTTPKVPAAKDPIAAIPKAGPARPCLAMG